MVDLYKPIWRIKSLVKNKSGVYIKWKPFYKISKKNIVLLKKFFNL